MLTLWDLNTPFQIDVLQLKSLCFDPNKKINCSYGFILVVNGSGNTLASNRRLDITRSNDDQKVNCTSAERTVSNKLISYLRFLSIGKLQSMHFGFEEFWSNGVKHANSYNKVHVDGILSKGPYPPCLHMADKALLARYPRCKHTVVSCLINTHYIRFVAECHCKHAAMCQKWYGTGTLWIVYSEPCNKRPWAHNWNFLKITFALILILMIQSSHNFAHVTTARLSRYIIIIIIIIIITVTVNIIKACCHQGPLLFSRKYKDYVYGRC